MITRRTALPSALIGWRCRGCNRQSVVDKHWSRLSPANCRNSSLLNCTGVHRAYRPHQDELCLPLAFQEIIPSLQPSSHLSWHTLARRPHAQEIKPSTRLSVYLPLRPNREHHMRRFSKKWTYSLTSVSLWRNKRRTRTVLTVTHCRQKLVTVVQKGRLNTVSRCLF